MQFYSSFLLILCERLQLSGGAELNLFSDLGLHAKLWVQGLGRFLMSIGNNLKLPHFDLIRCSAKAAELFFLPVALPSGLAQATGNFNSFPLFSAFDFLPLVSWMASSTWDRVKVTGREYWQKKITLACFLIFYLWPRFWSGKGLLAYQKMAV